MIKLNQPVGGVFNLTESSKATYKYRKKEDFFVRQIGQKNVLNQVLNNKGLPSPLVQAL